MQSDYYHISHLLPFTVVSVS